MVAMGAPSCECLDWRRHYMPCKHMLGLVTLFGWEALSADYRNSPLFLLDMEIEGSQPPADLGSQSPARLDTEIEGSQPPADLDSEIDGSLSPAYESDIHACSSFPAQNLSMQQSVDQELDATSAPSHTSDDPVGSANVQLASSLLDLARVQSKVRQLLSCMTAHTYTIGDHDFLNQEVIKLKEQLQRFRKKATAEHPVIHMKQRRRIAKKIGMGITLKQRVQMLRTRKRHRQKLLRQKKGNGWCNVLIVYLCMVLFYLWIIIHS